MADDAVEVIEVEATALSSKNVEAFRTAMALHVVPGRRLLLDMQAISYLDSSGCGALVTLARKMKDAGGTLKLCAITPSVRALFDLVRLHLVLDFYPTRAAALEAFANEASPPRG